MTSQTSYLFSPTETVSLPIAGLDVRFPVHRIYCVGRNYLEHIREMNEDEKSPPFFFQKPADSIVQPGGCVPYALNTNNLHYEVELVAALSKPLVRCTREQALDAVFGYAVGVDMTRRDCQRKTMELAQPWETGKSFDHSAPCGPITPVSQSGHRDSGSIRLWVNGVLKQEGDLLMMIWKLPDILVNLSQQYRLQPGDLVYTGTPQGVGPVVANDTIHCEVDGLAPLSVTIGAPLSLAA